MKTKRECQCDICQSYPVMSPEWQQKSIERTNERECPHCEYNGVIQGFDGVFSTCPHCGGSKRIKNVQWECPESAGNGKIYYDGGHLSLGECETCHGSGKIQEKAGGAE